MRLAVAVGLTGLLCVTATLAAADKPPGLGPLRVGQPLDRVRAAIPAAKWTASQDVSISAKEALKATGLVFDVEYEDLSWDRYRLKIKGSGASETSAACRDDIMRFLAAIEEANGALAAPAADSTFKGSREVISVGKSSQAKLQSRTFHYDSGGMLELTEVIAEQKRDTTTINAVAQISRQTNAKQFTTERVAYALMATFEATPPRPAQGVVPFTSLQVTNDASIGLIHHSLDGAPEPPEAGIDVELDCTIAEAGGALRCAEPQNGESAARPFVGAALKRAAQLHVSRRTRDGKWTPGEKTAPRLRIAPQDRRTFGPIDISKSDLLRIVGGGKMPPTRFPAKAAERLSSGHAASADVNCVVQSDGSLICPEITVTAEKFADDFKASILATLLRVRYDLLLTNGESSTGVGLHLAMDFRIE